MAVFAEYALLSKCLETLPPNVLKIIDTVELFFRHPERFETPGLAPPQVCSPSSELTALARADVLIAIHANDAQALRYHVPHVRVITLAHTYRRAHQRREPPELGSILYVASANPFNVHGQREFLAHAWPLIVSRAPYAVLRVVGSLPRVENCQAGRVVHVGPVSDVELLREYQTAHVVINPQVAGTGLKIKCVEALSAGCPLVMNRAGADGLEPGEGHAFLVANNWQEFANHVVRLLSDDGFRRALQSHARGFAEQVFSPEEIFSELASALSLQPSTR